MRTKIRLTRKYIFYYNNLMNRVFDILKKYMIFIAVLIGISIVLGMSYSNFIVASENHKVAEMYIGTLKYSMTIDGTTTNTLSVPVGETIVDVTITNENPIDTYYKLIYQNNSNVSIKYYQASELDSSNNISKTYDKSNDKIISNNTNTIKLKITNNSSSLQSINFKIVGGFATNTLSDVIVPNNYSEIDKIISANTYFCTTTSTLAQSLQYVNGQYTYAYKLEGKSASSGLAWSYISNGWGVQLTDKASTDAVTSKVCTYINNKPITSMSYMFYKSKATTLDVSNFDTSNVTNMKSMFWNSQATTLDVSNFDTSNVTNMYGMFENSQATTLDVSNFDTSKVTNMGAMFSYSQATTLDVSNFDTSKVINMNAMFYYSKATTLDVSHFDTSNVTNMSVMFSNSQATTLDVSNFNTSNVTDMSSMFNGSQATTLDLSNFNTSKVTDMKQMFYNSQATTLDVSHFDTSNVTDMSWMFSSSKATTIDLSSFDTSKVTNMSYMFYKATNLKTIYGSSKFVTTAVTSSTGMFSGCTNLVGGAGTKYNGSYVDKTYVRIDGGTSSPGYFTDIADKPSTFPTDSWATIVASVKAGNTRGYKVGDTKTIDMGTYGTHTLRIANMSTPNECSTEGFSQTACGFVLEFADIITTYKMNDTYTNVGGWPATSMRTFVNNDVYNALPSELRKAIIDTVTVSSHGVGDTGNFTSTDKLYLLSTAEVWIQGTSIPINNDTARDNTRQLDYYNNLGTSTNNYSKAIKNNGTSSDYWWLRSAYSTASNDFYHVNASGGWSYNYPVQTYGVSPAFRIG